jgi:DNA-binding response OmpR family regulator
MAERILVVNDTQEILELFEDLLTDEGYEVVLYSFGIQDMEEVARVRADLIILDLIIGGEQVGWQLLQKIKMTRSTASIPIIICTAAVNAVQEMEGYLKSKKVGLVLKPFDIDDLLHAVRRALDPRISINPSDIDESDAAEPDREE